MSALGCAASLPDGRPCRAPRLRDGDLCVFHDPEHADKVAEARRRGGRHRRREQPSATNHAFRGLRDAEAIRYFLDVAASDTLALEPSATRVRLIVAVADAAIRLLGPGDLEQRLVALEAARREEDSCPVGDLDGLTLPESAT
jgi:hypothetical protein